MGRGLWSGAAALLSHVSPGALPTSAVAAHEPDGAHAIGSPTGQAWSSPCSPSLASWKSHASQAGRVATPPADPRLVMPADVNVQAQSRFQAYARRTKPSVRATFRSVGMGTPSRTVQERLPPGAIFHACPIASVADHWHFSSIGSSRAPAAPALIHRVGSVRGLIMSSVCARLEITPREGYGS